MIYNSLMYLKLQLENTKSSNLPLNLVYSTSVENLCVRRSELSLAKKNSI